MRHITCNKCGSIFKSIRDDVSRIRCPNCGSNESLSIREEQISPTIKTSQRSTKVSRAAVRKVVQSNQPPL